jgi:hypothetical protein
MNRRALFFGLLYCLTVIIFKLIVVLGGFTFSKFGFYYSNIVSVFLIFPFFFLAIYLVREKDYGGLIRGKEAARIALTVLVVGMIGVSIYNYIEFNWKFRELSVEYYNGNEFLNILKAQQVKHPDKVKTEDFPKIIKEQIEGLSAFKATTGKLFSLLFLGMSGAFVVSVLMKRSQK